MGGSGHSRLLRVLHIDPERNWGGGEAQVFGLLKNLADWGHRNDLASDPDGRLFRLAQSLDVGRIPLQIRNDLDLRAVPALRRIVQEKRYDIVHLHTKRAHALSVWLPRRAWGPKYLVTRRMDYPEANNLYIHYLYNRRVDGVVAISQSIADLLVKAGVDHDRIRLIHSGIDPAPFLSASSNRTVKDLTPVIGAIGILEKRKGHRFLLQAARILKNQGRHIKYVLAGDGSQRVELERMAQTLGVAEDVTFAGFVTDVPLFLSAIDFLVMPSLYEGLGVAALEAMAARKPVIGTRVGGLAESIVDGETGFLVPPEDGGAIASAIARILADPAMAEEMGRKGAQRIFNFFTLERMAKKNEEYYYALLERHP